MGARVSGENDLVDSKLAVVFTEGLNEPRELEEAVRDRVELGLSQEGLELGVVDFDGGGHEDPRVREPDLPGFALKVVDVHGAGDALPPEHLVLLDVNREPSVAVDVTEEELAAVCEDPVGLLEHPGLVGAQVDDAVADHQVLGLVLNAGLVQVLDVALGAEQHQGGGRHTDQAQEDEADGDSDERLFPHQGCWGGRE